MLTLKELFALADAMPEKHRTLTLVCGLGGLRYGEAVALRRRDVDLALGVVRVVHNATRAGGQKMLGPPKTNASRREVALPTIVVESLRDHLRNSTFRGRDGLVFPGQDGDLLAPTALYGRTARVETRGGKQYEKNGYGFYAARAAIGKPTLHWHDLRRTAATLGAQHGATVREMQHRLGHTTPTMALQYQQATADRDRAVADRLQAAIDAGNAEA
ncbi:site-specific integrase [Allobranchiibius sp. GilTou38]|uniref:tyrosine-type recombinase/integrase n=1 Tax=Allobranchiibius sp. GilTou38 TaxID=2815210 RepID=UPI00325FFAC0